jgi:hypothetical protein
MTTRMLTTAATHERSAILAMYAGLAFTAVAIVVPFVDHATANVLADHIRSGYPDYSQDHIDSSVATYLAYLSIIGCLGVICWLWTIRAVKHSKRWARAAATVLFLLGTGISLTNLLVKDGSGDTGLPPLLGWVGMLPCLPGLVAVMLLWRDRHVASA